MVNNNKQWDQFSEYLDFLVESQHRIMEQTEDSTILYRSQGAIFQLRRLKLLRDEVQKTK